MTKRLEERVTFLTPSMGTKWLAYSQGLLQLNFPECKRIVVPGSKKFDPLYFVNTCEDVKTDYQVLVDEDCFILDRTQFLRLLDCLDENPAVAVMATPDGGTFHRHYNPTACNTFFAIIRKSALKKVVSAVGWRDYEYSDVERLVNRDHVEKLDITRISYSRKEPYYPFFWAVLASGGTIQYIIPGVEKNLLATEITLDGFSHPCLLHMWWLRQWFSSVPDSYLKVSNKERYQRLEREVLAPRFSGLYPSLLLSSLQFQRLLGRLFDRVVYF
ncbi:MAG: hypothetical protein IPN92_17750 [Chromatiaceae bacterium]|nr:hypothetical protein [Chromatiaceae bacterium]